MFCCNKRTDIKYKDTPFNSTMNENSTSRIFDEAPSSQKLKMATPSKKSIDSVVAIVNGGHIISSKTSHNS